MIQHGQQADSRPVAMSGRPLADCVVVDITQYLSGPLCTMLLADLGATVIKVEAPRNPDPLRVAGGGSESAVSGAFATLNRGKRSVSMDLKGPEQLARMRRLLRRADVFVENLRPGAAERLGLGYEEVAALNPRLVYASISGFGATGPLAHLGGYDLVAQAMSGIMSVTGFPGDEPLKAGVPLTDVGAGVYAAFGVLAALMARERYGAGQRVDCSLFEAGLSYGVWEAAEFWASGRSPEAVGNRHRSMAPYQVIRAAGCDRFVVAANTDAMFESLCRIIGRADMPVDDRFATNGARLEHLPALVDAIETVTTQQPADHWVDRLNAAGVPAGRLLDHGAALNHPQTLARGMVVDVPVAGGGSVRVLGNPVHLSGTPVGYGTVTAELGGDDRWLEEWLEEDRSVEATI